MRKIKAPDFNKKWYQNSGNRIARIAILVAIAIVVVGFMIK